MSTNQRQLVAVVACGLIGGLVVAGIRVLSTQMDFWLKLVIRGLSFPLVIWAMIAVIRKLGLFTK